MTVVSRFLKIPSPQSHLVIQSNINLGPSVKGLGRGYLAYKLAGYDTEKVSPQNQKREAQEESVTPKRKENKAGKVGGRGVWPMWGPGLCIAGCVGVCEPRAGVCASVE